MMLLQRALALSLITTSFFACQSPEKACSPQTRAAYDVGSGTTKLKVAKVDPCEGKILKVLANEQIKVGYKESLQRQNRFSKQVQQAGLKALKKLKSKASEYSLDKIQAVATEAFREAENGQAMIAAIAKKVDLDVTIITQEKEALLGYIAAINQVEEEAKHLVVWDIGGGSQQIIFSDSDNNPKIDKNTLGAVAFKAKVVSEIEGKNPQGSPNPLSSSDVESARQLARKLIPNFPKSLKTVLRRAPTQVLGIGGVHAYSVIGQVDNGKQESYTLEDVQQAITERTGWSDAQFESEYAETQLTNLILVEQMMKDMGVRRIQTLQVNLTDGLLIQ